MLAFKRFFALDKIGTAKPPTSATGGVIWDCAISDNINDRRLLSDNRCVVMYVCCDFMYCLSSQQPTAVIDSHTQMKFLSFYSQHENDLESRIRGSIRFRGRLCS